MSNFQQFEGLSETEVIVINGGTADDLPFFIANIGGSIGSLVSTIPPVITGAGRVVNTLVSGLQGVLSNSFLGPFIG